jgi:hypothetical protein
MSNFGEQDLKWVISAQKWQEVEIIYLRKELRYVQKYNIFEI